MSIVHLNRIKNLLESQVFEHLDDLEIKKNKPSVNSEELSSIKLSQGFALYTAKCLTADSYSNLKNYLLDDFHDNGIDMIYYSDDSNTLFLIQSKWIRGGNGGVDQADIHKFLKGVKDLLHLKFDEFNDKIKKHAAKLESSILNPNVRIDIVLSYSGKSLSTDNYKLITNLINEFNDTDEVIFFTDFNLSVAYGFLKDSLEGEPINADLDIYEWGKTDEPVKCYYGLLYAGQIAELFSSNQSRIFSKNIRGFIGESEINKDIIETVVKSPENFFYLNNGLTLICKKIKKLVYGANDRHVGKFHLEDLTIINGAQTVGSINSAFSREPEKVASAKVFVKIISLENCPVNFGQKITVATNTQNKIEKRDFVSLDKQQERIKNEIMLAGYYYHAKRDDKKIIYDQNNFYLEEATIALACFHEDVDYSTYAKREIGKLWEDTTSKPYTDLFNDKLQPHKLINLIKVFRAIDSFIKKRILINEHRLICSHGLYFISHVHLQNMNKELILNPSNRIEDYLDNGFLEEIETWTNRTVSTYMDYFQVKFPLPIFKNFNYCRKMKNEMYRKEGKPVVGQTLFLFQD